MDLVYECFVKLGLRYVCITREGRFAGMVRPFPLHLSSHRSFPIAQSNVETDPQKDICKVHARTRRKGRARPALIAHASLAFQHFA